MTVYGPRCNVHPDRTGAARAGPYRLLVVHTSEGGEGATSAENLCSFMASPGDRVDPADGSRYGASYHYVTDTDRVLPATRDDVVAFAAAGANNDGVHICIPGRAAQTRDQWLDGVSRAYIRQLAAVMVDKSRELGIPLQPLAVVQIVAGRAGYCGHVDISHAYKRSTHTDPGPSFPWDVLGDDIRDLIAPNPPEDDDMAVRYFKLTPTAITVWAVADDLNATRLEQSECDARGVNPATVPVLPDADARRFRYHPGLPRASVT